MDVDVAIVGAGPSGLCFAKMLSKIGLRVAIIERNTRASLEDPAFDGREIALTHRSVEWLSKLGAWSRIPAEAISALRDAQVLNGGSLNAMKIGHELGKQAELGFLVANHLIRRAAYETVATDSHVQLLTGLHLTRIEQEVDCARLTLSDQQQISCQLLVAADSRFSETRHMMGISADRHDFGRAMMVCVMEHERPHQHTAWEWFDYGQTLALLPMNGMQSSVVVTLPPQEIATLMAMCDEDFNRNIEVRFRHRLGAMRVTSTRHAYPLVTTYPRRFVGTRFALIGDAAVGMHPVTAHGFNFGLQGAATLAGLIADAHRRGADIASAKVLGRYELKHRLATKPLFAATHLIAKLYGDDQLPMRLLRRGLLRVCDHVTPFKRLMAYSLSDQHVPAGGWLP